MVSIPVAGCFDVPLAGEATPVAKQGRKATVQGFALKAGLLQRRAHEVGQFLQQSHQIQWRGYQ
jgi:hypothetical protein